MTEKQSKNDFIFNLVKKAEEDMDFRDKLKNNPRETIEELLSISLPESIKILVHEDTREVVNIVLPPLKRDDLSEGELDLVAGGDVCWCINKGSCSGCHGCNTF